MPGRDAVPWSVGAAVDGVRGPPACARAARSTWSRQLRWCGPDGDTVEVPGAHLVVGARRATSLGAIQRWTDLSVVRHTGDPEEVVG